MRSGTLVRQGTRALMRMGNADISGGCHDVTLVLQNGGNISKMVLGLVIQLCGIKEIATHA